MTSTVRDVIDRLHARKHKLEDAMSYCLNFDSEGPEKLRKLARFEGELAGIDEAIGIVETVGTAESVVVI